VVRAWIAVALFSGIMSVLQRREVHMGFGAQPGRWPVQRHFVFLTFENDMMR
jgi:hypothetical protein